jgi:hypothetical protein
MKKIKDEYTREDLASLFQLVLPGLLLLFYTIFCSIFVQASLASYDSYFSAWLQCSELLPETSISLMNTLFLR